MNFVRRNLTACIVDGARKQVSDGTDVLWRTLDVKPSVALRIDDSKLTLNKFSLAASGSYVLQLPPGYSSAERLAVVLTVVGVVQAVIVSPAVSTSTQLIASIDGQAGILSFQERVTSITLSNPTASTTAYGEYCVFEIPDLTSPDAYRDGTRTIGYY